MAQESQVSSADQVVCLNCGASIAEDASSCPNCGWIIRRETHYCSNCGQRVEGHARFCSYCGTATGIVLAQPQHQVTYFPVRLAIEYEYAKPEPWWQLITNRLLLFVKWLFAIPLYFVMVFYGLIAFIVTFIDFWVILFRGRSSKTLFDFLRGFIEYQYQVLAYFPLLLTNHWFPGESHPLRVEIDYPSSNSRLVLLFLKLPSFLLEIIPGLISLSFLILFLLAIPVWWLILASGRYPRWWFTLNQRVLAWSCGVTAWQGLIRDDAMLFGTTTPVKVLVGIWVALSLIVLIGQCSTSL